MESTAYSLSSHARAMMRRFAMPINTEKDSLQIPALTAPYTINTDQAAHGDDVKPDQCMMTQEWLSETNLKSNVPIGTRRQMVQRQVSHPGICHQSEQHPS